MQLTEKEFLNRFKLYFATLFARSMPYVIVGYSDVCDNEFICSNIPLDKMELFENSITYYIHRVTILDKEFLSDLYEVFPLFRTHECMLNINTVNSALNKHGGSISTVQFNISSDTTVHITVKQKKSEELLTIECGNVISDFTAQRYFEVYNQAYVAADSNNISIDLKGKINLTNKISIVEHPINDRVCKIAILNNGSCVSAKEFIPKSKIDTYDYTLLVKENKGAMVVNGIFNSPMIQVTSVHPAVIWFTKPA